MRVLATQQYLAYYFQRNRWNGGTSPALRSTAKEVVYTTDTCHLYIRKYLDKRYVHT